MRSLILGCGYTGSYLVNALKEVPGGRIVATRRKSLELPKNDDLKYFDLNDRDSWASLLASSTGASHSYDQVYWLFPAEPLELVRDFYDVMKDHMKKLVVVGSTSAFVVQNPGERIDEKSTLNLSIPRVEGEEFLRSCGATIVRAAGIYGPQRDPRDWVKRRLIKAGKSFLNLIHVEDLAQMLCAAGRQEGSHHWIASDQTPLRWNDIIDKLQLDPGPAYRREIEKEDSKFIDSSQSWRESQILPRYRNLFEGIHSICESQRQ